MTPGRAESLRKDAQVSSAISLVRKSEDAVPTYTVLNHQRIRLLKRREIESMYGTYHRSMGSYRDLKTKVVQQEVQMYELLSTRCDRGLDSA